MTRRTHEDGNHHNHSNNNHNTASAAAATSHHHTGDAAWRIVTGGLDGLCRIHTWSSQTGRLEYIHGFQIQEGPVTCMAVNETHDRLAIGTSTGFVLVRQKGPSITQHKRTREPKAGTYAFFTRGQNVSLPDPQQQDYVATMEGKKRKLRSFDVKLKQFRYADALDEALETRQPQAVMAVLEELGKRRGLVAALSHRDEESLEPILSFCVRYISQPRFSMLLIGVAHQLIDIYASVSGQSETVDELFNKLREQVKQECRAQKCLLRLVGQLDGFLTAGELERITDY
jgi:U3 small nucleolar RNA-associated protein 15